MSDMEIGACSSRCTGTIEMPGHGGQRPAELQLLVSLAKNILKECSGPICGWRRCPYSSLCDAVRDECDWNTLCAVLQTVVRWSEEP